MNKVELSSRRNDYDITNQINVTDPGSVSDYVCQIYTETYNSNREVSKIRQAFTDFEALFDGRFPGYFACDTLYHDMQHTLDVTLTMARLLNGYEREHSHNRLGERRFTLGIIVALFHDAGYIRAHSDSYAANGAVYTLSHVTRSASFLARYLSSIGLEAQVGDAVMLVHFTGYELDLSDIHLDSQKDYALGSLLGTSDLISQMSDRCYLEKCRDRLYPEFVMCGLAGETSSQQGSVVFASAGDLLKKTPSFYRNSVIHRLSRQFNNAFNFARAHFVAGYNPYMDYIQKNMLFLENLNASGELSMLRRQPPEPQSIELPPRLELAG